MSNRKITNLLLLGTLAFGIPTTQAEDWPRWRGADGTGVSLETDWANQGKEDSLWSTNVGLGYASFVISNGRVITSGYDDDESIDTIYCLETETGQSIWKHSFPSKKWDQAHKGGTLTTPVIDGEFVYALGREGQFFCLKFSDGTVVWEKDLKKTYDLDYPTWMFSASPLIIDDVVYLNVGRTLALNKHTGEAIWETGKTGHAYSTPYPYDFDGRACLLVFNSDGLFVYDQSDGEALGNHEWKTKYDINAATPIVIGKRIFISSGQNRGCAMLELNDEGLKVVWENKEMSNKMTGCILWDDHLYGFDDSTLKCIDLDGQEKWRQRGLGLGTLMIAQGRLIIISDKGELIIADASPGGYSELSKQRVLDGGVYWTMPVLSNGLIYVRNSKGDVVCRDHRDDA